MNLAQETQQEAAAMTHHAQRIAEAVGRSPAPNVNYYDRVQIVRAVLTEINFIDLAASAGTLHEMGGILGYTASEEFMRRANEAYERATGRKLERKR